MKPGQAYEPENAMEAKLRKMQLDLRVQLNTNEDRQGYDSYRSPITNKKLEFNEINAAKPTEPAADATKNQK
jgi:hypothetical protein